MPLTDDPASGDYAITVEMVGYRGGIFYREADRYICLDFEQEVFCVLVTLPPRLVWQESGEPLTAEDMERIRSRVLRWARLNGWRTVRFPMDW